MSNPECSIINCKYCQSENVIKYGKYKDIRAVSKRDLENIDAIIHLFLCIMSFKFLQGVTERFEKFNFGGTNIIKGLKVR